jgi:predicted  nucleic acid-binding Zn-ribbon protein
MEDVLQSLANLQYLDSKIDEISRLKGDLPEEILDIEAEINRLENRINHLNKESEMLLSERNQLQLDIEESIGLVDRYEKQQMTVRNNREYDALTKEIEAQRTRTENARSRTEQIAILLEEMEKNVEDNTALLHDTHALIGEKRTQLAELNQRTAEEELELQGKRDEAASKVGERYLRSYERLRKGLNNSIAVVAMERGSCLGFMLPPQVQMEVRRREKIVIDENSGRIVIDESFFAEARNIYG